MDVNEVNISLTLKVEHLSALRDFLTGVVTPAAEPKEPAPAPKKRATKKAAKKATKKASAKSADTKEARHVEAADAEAKRVDDNWKKVVPDLQRDVAESIAEVEAEPEDVGPTLDDIRAAVRSLIHLKRNNRVAAVLEEFGASKLPEVKKADYAAVLARLKQEAEA